MLGASHPSDSVAMKVGHADVGELREPGQTILCHVSQRFFVIRVSQSASQKCKTELKGESEFTARPWTSLSASPLLNP